MCSILINNNVDIQLQELERSDDRNMIEKRLYDFARESDTNTPGFLDNSIHHMKRMPHALRNTKKLRIGRHRIYYTGHHRECSYFVFFIKEFKRTGVNDEDDREFQNRLIRFLSAPMSRELSLNE